MFCDPSVICYELYFPGNRASMYKIYVTYKFKLDIAKARGRYFAAAVTGYTIRRCRKVVAHCRVAGYTAQHWFGQPGGRRPEACKDHTSDDEVNVYDPRRQAGGCSTRSHFGHEGERAKFCHSHFDDIRLCSSREFIELQIL